MTQAIWKEEFDIRSYHTDFRGKCVNPNALPVFSGNGRNHARDMGFAFEQFFVARKSDVDLNRHVNNVSYVEWAVETVPDDVWRTHLLTEIEVSFRAETLYGETVVSQSDQVEEEGQQVFRHRVVRESDQAEMFLARTGWDRIDRQQD